MAKKKNAPSSRKKSASRKTSAKNFAKEKVSRVVNQVKEPLSLLQTLKAEGMSNAMALIGIASSVASGATKNLRLENIKPQLFDLFTSMGFALREDLERLEARVEELETRLLEKEFESIRASDEE